MIFFLPLLVHILAGLSCVIIGIVAFSVPKRRGRHPRWGRYYLWIYSLVFLTAAILAFEHWQKDAYLFFTALVAYGLALIGFAAGCMRRNTRISMVLRKRWVRIHILGMTGSYIGLLTAFLLDNGDQIPLVNRLPAVAYWFLPGIMSLPFLVRSLWRYAPNRKNVQVLPFKKKLIQ
jgi:hypothetical protein